MERAYVVNFQPLWNYSKHKSCHLKQGNQCPLRGRCRIYWLLIMFPTFHYVSRLFLPSLPPDGWSLLYSIHMWTKNSSSMWGYSMKWAHLHSAEVANVKFLFVSFHKFFLHVHAYASCCLLKWEQPRHTYSIPCFFSNLTSHNIG